MALRGPSIRPVLRFRALALPALLSAIVLISAACGDAGTPEARTGRPAPPLTGTALDGTPVDLSALKGRPVIVNFWASWCTPCREEFPLFQEKLAELGPTDGLEMIGVLYKDEPELAQAFLDDLGATWPTMDDPDGALAKAWRTVAPPQTYFIDKDGVVRGIQIGQVTEQDFDTQYAKIKP
jgi:cytochrome c biogenesis protein CcmG/thiol:disulfide interchange protein DsbE